MTTLTPNSIVTKSFVVGRPINATVSRYDVVTVNITLQDENETVVNLTGCSVQCSSVDTIGHLWGTTITDAVNGKFSFTFQPLVVGRTDLYAMVTKSVTGQDDVTTTFYLGDFSVAYEENTPQTHIVSLTEQLQEAADDANEAAERAEEAAESVENIIDDTSTASTKCWSAQKVNSIVGDVESALEALL